MNAKETCNRWMELIQAEQRNARVSHWWDLYRDGSRRPRIVRMHAINKACSRTERVANFKVYGMI